MRSALFALAVPLLIALPASAGHTASAPYDVGNVVLLGVITNPGFAQVGGFVFPASTSAPVRVDVADASGQNVYIVVCQDLNGQLCGEAGEPRAARCGKFVTLSSSAVAFQAGRDTAVFVYTSNVPGTPVCTGLATSGIITVTYA